MVKESLEIINKQPFTVRLKEGKLYPSLHVESEEGTRDIPVFSVRNSEHYKLIAEHVTSGSVGAFEVGVIGIVKAVSSDPLKDNGGGDFFWKVKKGRERADKVPMMMSPEQHDLIVDYNLIHPSFAFLKDAKKRREFYGKFPFHVVLPLAEGAKVNKDVFVTTVDDSRKKTSDQHMSYSTVCIFYPGEDKAWDNITQLANTINPNVHLGITSFNDHNEQSPWNFDELISYCNSKQKADFSFVVRDPIVAKHEIKSSMTIIKLPHINEPLAISVMRKGSIGIETLRTHVKNITGEDIPIIELKSAKFASHGHVEEIRNKGLDDRVLRYLREINS
jgi:hypothetical protein